MNPLFLIRGICCIFAGLFIGALGIVHGDTAEMGVGIVLLTVGSTNIDLWGWGD